MKGLGSSTTAEARVLLRGGEPKKTPPPRCQSTPVALMKQIEPPAPGTEQSIEKTSPFAKGTIVRLTPLPDEGNEVCAID